MLQKALHVRCWREPVTLPTYEPQPPDKNPMFLEKRVYQGSSGKVYPLPFIDRIAEKPEPHLWDAIHLENEYLYVMILPQLGGRIHIARDKTNGYDFIYKQDVIKPALVGLAGPWISGGIEFNWPQHHRPSTFMPVDVQIEKDDVEGSVVVWMSEHDPMARMKGMHGVALKPGEAVLEVKVRAYNRTTLPQTFLWWANVATRVHERYQSFFPPDVTYVADHAKRAMSTFPLADGSYYGVNYGSRAAKNRKAESGNRKVQASGIPQNEIPTQFVPPHCIAENPPASNLPPSTSDHLAYAPNDLSWYANIPVPTSYMCMGTEEDFFGGYDHAKRAGLVHVADHRIAPGKKQWTWGNHAFGYAWDRNLTDPDATGEYAPYIELMAGVFTDNQPDFSFLGPGETKTWSQYWYPIREIGAAHQANLSGAVSLRVEDGRAHIGVSVTSPYGSAMIELRRHGQRIFTAISNLAPGSPFTAVTELPSSAQETELRLAVYSVDRRPLISYQPKPRPKVSVPPAAIEPPAPADVANADELYLNGLHLDQYRHATRTPADYWREALRRDPGDARCNDALGLWLLRRGEWDEAAKHFRAAIARLTIRNPNPADGMPHYHLGEALRNAALSEPEAEAKNAKLDAAYDSFFKATWSQAAQPAAFHALAEMDCCRGNWSAAIEHLDRALELNATNLRARDLKVIILRRMGRNPDAEAFLSATLAMDPLDWWARFLRGNLLTCDTQTLLDLVYDHLRAGLHAEALAMLEPVPLDSTDGTAPLVRYTLAWICHLMGDRPAARKYLTAAAKTDPDYCFPARLEEIPVLQFAMATNSRDARAPYYLGNLFYDRRRHREAIALWEKSAKLDTGFSVVWRNLGIGCFNVLQQPAKAKEAYDQAVKASPRDARLIYERDQLWKRLGVSPRERLRELEKHRARVVLRDDLTIEFCALLNQNGRHDDALKLVAQRKFQPWEGGEGLALGQHVRTHLALGRAALVKGDAAEACTHFEAALGAPENLGEAKHLLANQSDIYFWLGCAFEKLGDEAGANEQWTKSANFRGDFQEMSVRAFSEMTFWSARASEKLGRKDEAKKLFRGLLGYAQELAEKPAKIDYFATSLPTLLLFDDDLDARQQTTAKFLEAQARLGLGETAVAQRLLREVLKRDPSHAAAADLSEA